MRNRRGLIYTPVELKYQIYVHLGNEKKVQERVQAKDEFFRLYRATVAKTVEAQTGEYTSTMTKR